MHEKPEVEVKGEQRDRSFLAVVLIILGLLALLSNFVTVTEDVGILALILVGVVFLAYGLYAWRFGFTIPGCIITGTGIGVFVSQRLVDPSGEVEGGIIVLGLAAGFIAISILSYLFKQKNSWWPLIPGGILGVVGAMLTINTPASLDLLEQVGRFWPLILLVIGVWILLDRHEQQRD
ncbi:MAG: hypothetical protein JNJ61_03325 [Anaerolineae bacterium]|nr:hypothetical protein [Anaerolineae bacterium]